MRFPSPKRRPRWGAETSELSVLRFKDGLFSFRGGLWLDESICIGKDLKWPIFTGPLLHFMTLKLRSEKHLITTSPYCLPTVNNSLLHKVPEVCLLLQETTKHSSGMKMDFVFQCRYLVTSRSWQGAKLERSKPSSRYDGYTLSYHASPLSQPFTHPFSFLIALQKR